MFEIPILTLMPSSGAVPSSEYDPVSQAEYTEWELNDEARFSFVVPAVFQPGSDIVLTLQESTPAAGLNHKWQATILLMRPAAHETDAATEQDTVSNEYASSSTADLLTTRSFNLTSGGAISGLAVAAGDMISVCLKRIAASGTEDSNPVKLFYLSVSITLTAETGTGSGCYGRVGQIVEDVRQLFNDDGGGFIENDALILHWINRCLADIAQAGYWRTTGTIALVSGTASYDLLSGLSGFIDVHGAEWNSGNRPQALVCLSNRARYDWLKSLEQSGSRPEYYYVESNILHLTPVPTSSSASGLAVHYSYLPDELDCYSGYTPPIPKAYDTVLINYCLAQSFKKDRSAPDSDRKFQDYQALYERGKADLMEQNTPPITVLRSYRS